MATTTSQLRPTRVLGAVLISGWILGVGVLAAGLAPTRAELIMAPEAAEGPVKRGPYLQMASDSGVHVRWRTEQATDSMVWFGLSPTALTQSARSAPVTTEHEVVLAGLSPDTRYYYAIGDSDQTLLGGDSNHTFRTHPVVGTAKRTRIWAIGDSGTPLLAAIRDAYEGYAAGTSTDVFLMLGDNAYPEGTDWQYQAVVFNVLHDQMRKWSTWSTIGNHDAKSAESPGQSGVYYDVFSFPTRGESGGLPSGTEAYYSFDYGNIHFVCLNSQDIDRSPDGAMLQWLEADLAETNQAWTIAFWHHPPYSKGSHDSDEDGQLIEMRQYALPILEAYGVDLVLSGHSHAYERSFLTDGHYGLSDTFTPSMLLNDGDGRADGDGPYAKDALGAAPHQGAVYVVSGSSGIVDPEGRLNHPVMYIGLKKMGSMVIDVDHNVLDARLLDWKGETLDHFSLVKGAGSVPAMPADLVAVANLGSQVDLSWADLATNETHYVVERSPNGSGWAQLATLPAGSSAFSDLSAGSNSAYLYRVQARNASGWSSWSNIAEIGGADTAGCAAISGQLGLSDTTDRAQRGGAGLALLLAAALLRRRGRR